MWDSITLTRYTPKRGEVVLPLILNICAKKKKKLVEKREENKYLLKDKSIQNKNMGSFSENYF